MRSKRPALTTVFIHGSICVSSCTSNLSYSFSGMHWAPLDDLWPPLSLTLYFLQQVLRRWAPTLGSSLLFPCICIRCTDWHLGLWGIGVGAAVSLFMSDVPVFKQDVLLKIPFVRFQAPFSLSLWRICLVVHYNNNARVFLSIGQTILY